MIDKATLEAERTDYEQQLAYAQQQVSAWQQKAMIAEGARQSIVALLAKVDTPETPETPE
jgi:hypothetical protein